MKNLTNYCRFLLLTVLLMAVARPGYGQYSDEFKILPADGAADDLFGQSVAIEGEYAIVGAPQDDDHGSASGSAYIFRRNAGGDWVLVKKLAASDAALGDHFGRSVAMSGDYAIVGAPADDDNGSSSGSAYIFSRNQGGSDNWGQVAKLTASDGAAIDQFGYSVAISGDDAIVGAYSDDDNGSSSGSAYVFSRNQGGSDNWGQVTKLTASDASAEAWFGYSVAISGDDAIVGALGDAAAGSAYVFSRNQGGSDHWGQVTKLTAADGSAGDNFGGSVALSGDYALIGADHDGDNGSYNSGSAYIFNRNQGGSDHWGQVTKLTASDGSAGDQFGYSVAISGDDAIVGALNDDDNGSDSGSTYIFSRNQGGSDHWGQSTKLTASDGSAGDQFGYSVAISGDYAISGAFQDDDNGDRSGSAYVFGPVPEIDVQGGSPRVSIANGDDTPSLDDGTNFGSANVGDSKGETFFIYNTGSANLNLTATPAVQFTGPHAADFYLSTIYNTSIAPGGNTECEIVFAPSAPGWRNATVVIPNNDPDENPYEFAIQGLGKAPEMDVERYGIIADGDMTPSEDDGTDIGSANVGDMKTVKFLINNIGDATLYLTARPEVQISGANASDFAFTDIYRNEIPGYGDHSWFYIQFNPSAPGVRSAIISIPNNDPDENPYDFAIQGTGLASEMDVQGNGTSIADGDDTPSTSDDTDFGEVEVAAGAVEHTFTIENTGNAELNLTGGSVLVSVDGNGFTLVADATTPVSADNSTTFTIRFEPTVAGVASGTVSIANDDTDENPYTFAIQGIGVVPVTSDWTDVSPGTAPAPRYWHATAYIGDGKMLLFGGTPGGYTGFNDTWLYDINSNTWTNKQPANPPGARIRMAMAYIGDGKVLMYGGSPVVTQSGYNPAVETWLYNLSTNSWTKLSPTGAPPALDGHAMCFSGGSDKVMMFGGRLIKQYTRSDQTWIFDLSENKWTRKSANKTRPSARASFAMAYFGTDQAVIFGGFTGVTQLDETWLYDRGSDKWTQLSPTDKPAARYNHAAAYLGGDKIMIFGGRADIISDPNGNSEPVIYGDTWIFDKSANTWTEDDNNDPSPDARANPRLAETSLNGSSRIVLFGGNTDSEVFGDTWTFGGDDYLAKEIALAEDDGEDTAEEITENNEVTLPTVLVLEQNYPNPFNPDTQIRFAIPEAGAVTLQIFNSAGQLVRTLVASNMAAGYHQVNWNATDDSGRRVASGVYIYVLRAGAFTAQHKLVLMK